MDAVAVEAMPASGPAPSVEPAGPLRIQRPPAALPGLEALVGALGCCFDTPCHPLLPLALLLSAAAAGARPAELGEEEGESGSDDEAESWVQRSACTSRAQASGAVAAPCCRQLACACACQTC